MTFRLNSNLSLSGKKEGSFMYKISELYDLDHTLAKDYLAKFEYPWQALSGIKDLILELGKNLGEDYVEVKEHVWVHKSANVFESAYLGAPCIIGPETEVRHCAFVRGSALVGANCVVGNSVELKNCILFDNVETPHYNYVGDSILGYHSHLGAGGITSNLKSARDNIILRRKDENYNVVEEFETGLRKIGAFMGDYVEVGCNSVLCPGTIIGPHTNVYPLSRVRGQIAANSIFKDASHMTLKD